MTTAARERITVSPNPIHESEIQELADFLRATPAAAERQAPCLVSPTGERQEIPAEVFAMLSRMVEALSEGRGVSVVPTSVRLTTQQAADHLGMSRPTLVKLLERGEIPFSTVGRHRRVALDDLIGYERRARRLRRQALADLTAETAADGDYFTQSGPAETR